MLDLTGGAPELNPHFRRLVQCGRRSGLRIIDRCNLTVLEEPGQEDTAEFLAAHQVEIVASLPCYLQENVDRQRGGGVYERSISALQNLNRLGYGMPGTGLILNLVYNPGGASLPPPQAELEPSYRRELRSRFGLEFTNLLTLTNMPIRRFADFLTRTDQHSAYLSLLANHFNPATVAELMCRSLLSVGYDGRLYDCDFNQMLALPTSGRAARRSGSWTVCRRWRACPLRPAPTVSAAQRALAPAAAGPWPEQLLDSLAQLNDATASSSSSKISKTREICVMVRTSRMLEGR